MAAAHRFCVAEERSGHCAAVDQHCLYVWGGYVTIEENEVYLPHDEIWVYDTESGLWRMHLTDGDLPPSMSGSCGVCLNGKLYIFGGYDDKGYSNQLYYVDLRSGTGAFTWQQVKHSEGQPPTARDKLSCWAYKKQLIYFGGYGCRRHNELNDCFDVHDASWEGQMFWGWNNDIHVFDTEKQAWIQPLVKQTRMNDLHSLNLDTWTWSGGIQITGEKPHGRSWHTLTPVGDDQLFLFGGLSAESVPLSDGWIYNLKTNVWTQFKHLSKDQPRFLTLQSCPFAWPRHGRSIVVTGDFLSLTKNSNSKRLWHTACPGKDNEVMVFGGSKDDLLSIDTGHCNDLLIFQTQPYPLLRLCLDSIGKNALQLRNQLSCLPLKLLQQAKKRITFWTAARFRQSRRESCYEVNNNKT
ncbi:kelch domain-containing protein 1 isoform X2 [Rhinoderma darwinii]|uniref:kelch domain-containing protein 1 isoform X2 n=1 Tax=Rhinoderma darwinii TaxID=43563 RepID=UPI003F66C738